MNGPLRAKVAPLVGLASDATDAQIVEAVRNLIAQRDHYRAAATSEPWRVLTKTWEKVGVGEMIEHDGKVWTVLERKPWERRRVQVNLWRNGKTFRRIYGFDDIATTLEPTAMIDAMKLLRAELGAVLMTPEEIEHFRTGSSAA